MPLRLVNKKRTYPVIIEDTTFNIISMTIAEKEELVYSLSNINDWSLKNPSKSVTARFLGLLSSAIVSINGYDDSVINVLGQIEDVKQLGIISKAIHEHCNLDDTETKNSSSSSEQPIPAQAGNADIAAKPEKERVSITEKTEK